MELRAATKVPSRGGDLGEGRNCKCGQRPQGTTFISDKRPNHL